MLRNANLLYLSGSILILFDRQYIGRLCVAAAPSTPPPLPCSATALLAHDSPHVMPMLTLSTLGYPAQLDNV